LDSNNSIINTSQETYRLIKYYFSQIGNTIESNKYHALELELYTKNNWKNIVNNFLLDDNRKPSSILNGIVTFFHKISSNHSTNWMFTLFWIFVVSFLTNFYLNSNLTSLECYFKYISILSKLEDFNGSYIVMTLNKISLGYLYYQFLTAVRKDTRK
jgi:predicted PurR-regulated permease PerM